MYQEWEGMQGHEWEESIEAAVVWCSATPELGNIYHM